MLLINDLINKVLEIILLTEALKRRCIVVYDEENKNKGLEKILEHRVIACEIYCKLVVKNCYKCS